MDIFAKNMVLMSPFLVKSLFFTLEFVATVGFNCIGTGWNSFHMKRYVDSKMSPDP